MYNVYNVAICRIVFPNSGEIPHTDARRVSGVNAEWPNGWGRLRPVLVWYWSVKWDRNREKNWMCVCVCTLFLYLHINKTYKKKLIFVLDKLGMGERKSDRMCARFGVRALCFALRSFSNDACYLFVAYFISDRLGRAHWTHAGRLLLEPLLLVLCGAWMCARCDRQSECYWKTTSLHIYNTIIDENRDSIFTPFR